MRWPWSKPVSVMSERLRCLLIQTITRWRSRRRTMVRAKRSSRFLLLKGFVSDLSAELIATPGSRQQVSSKTVPWASSNGCDKCATRQNIQTTIGRQRRTKTWLKRSPRPFRSSMSVPSTCVATASRRIWVQLFARIGFDNLSLQTYLTAGPKESRAWTIPKGAAAP